MNPTYRFSEFLSRFPNDDWCLEEIKKLRYPNGVFCVICNKITKHYKLKGRTAYSCKFCRNQIFPLANTIFEKTTTPLRFWFYSMFLMTHTRAGISVTQLQKELGVTYKTAWRMFGSIRMLMAQNNADLLQGSVEIDEAAISGQGVSSIHRWTLFNRLEISVIQRKQE